MTDQDNVWLLAKAAVDDAVLEMPETSNEAMSSL